MVIWRASEAKAYAIDYGMRAPRELDPADYPLAGSGTNKDLFAWPLVKDNRNVHGATAVAVPGVVVRPPPVSPGLKPSRSASCFSVRPVPCAKRSASPALSCSAIALPPLRLNS
jgi:hypothetical protein